MQVKDLRKVLDNFEDNEEIEFSLVHGFGRRKLKIGAAEPQEKGLYLELEEEIKNSAGIFAPATFSHSSRIGREKVSSLKTARLV